MMLSHKNILNGLGRAVYGGKPHNVPKALQSVNMKNTSEKMKEGGAGGLLGCACTEIQTCGDTYHFAISVHNMNACMTDVGQIFSSGGFFFLKVDWEHFRGEFTQTSKT